MNRKKNPPLFSDALLATILVAAPPAPATHLPAARQAAMKKALLKRVNAEVAAKPDINAYQLVRQGEGDWITFAPNVEMKELRDDGQTRSWLARFGPGGRIPEHIQSGDEEAFILEGWCWLDDVKIGRGDFHSIKKDQRHGNIHSPEGCLIFVRSDSEKRSAAELMAVR